MILHLPVSLLSGVSKCYLFSPTDPASSATWRVADEFVVWGSMSRVTSFRPFCTLVSFFYFVKYFDLSLCQPESLSNNLYT